MLDQLYFDGSVDDEERGPFAIICSHGIDGNVADVYGESIEEAEETARRIISICNWLLDDLSLLCFTTQDGAREVHRAWRDTMLAQGREVAAEKMEWETLSEHDKALDALVAHGVIRSFAMWALNHDGFWATAPASGVAHININGDPNIDDRTLITLQSGWLTRKSTNPEAEDHKRLAREYLVRRLVDAWTPQIQAIAGREIDSLLRFPEFDRETAAHYAGKAFERLAGEQVVLKRDCT